MKRNVSAYGMGAGSDRLVLARLGGSGDRLFGGLNLGYGGHGFDDRQNYAAGLDVGYAIPVGSGSTTFCPIAQSVLQLSERNFGTRQKLVTTSIGAAFGHTFKFSPSFSLVPFVQGGVLHRYGSYGAYTAFGTSYPGASGGLTGGQIGAGVGLRIANRLTLRPAVMVPLGFRGGSTGQSEPMYSLTASFALGKKR
ncbi:MAG: hypothetical protein ABI852_02485 [Gemmatimonadaceae bacterium]